MLRILLALVLAASGPRIVTHYGEGPQARPFVSITADAGTPFSIASEPAFVAWEAFGATCSPVPGGLVCEGAAPVVFLRFSEAPRYVVVDQAGQRAVWPDPAAPTPEPERGVPRVWMPWVGA